ncbi:hypothetical protein EJ07DRAFT_157649 [Lizonia empirigonia]|nr:hypothetical protein EJ07DRAFT_157649 [Lizonia empirigonia]
MFFQVLSQILHAVQPFFSPATRPWTKEEARKLLHQVYFNEITHPLEGRSREECQLILSAIMDPLIRRRYREAIEVYHTRNCKFSLEDLEDRLRKPRENYDEDIHYGVMNALLQLDGVSIDDRITTVVDDYFHTSSSN